MVAWMTLQRCGEATNLDSPSTLSWPGNHLVADADGNVVWAGGPYGGTASLRPPVSATDATP